MLFYLFLLSQFHCFRILETHSDLRVNAVNPIKFKTIVVVSERETKDGNKDERLDLYVTTVLLFKREEDQDREETLALAHAGSLLEVFGKENKHKYEIPNSILYYCDHNSDWTMAFTYMMFKNYEDYKITKELIFPTKPFEKVN